MPTAHFDAEYYLSSAMLENCKAAQAEFELAHESGRGDGTDEQLARQRKPFMHHD